jgi:phosphatidylethanolamine/phosphatidyl-N-methylethanolamine N-methyltransferase
MWFENLLINRSDHDNVAPQVRLVPAAAIHGLARLEDQADHRVLLKEILKAPRQIGAVCPSSTRLANRIAQQIDASSEGFVVELGGGTGVVTESLLKRGIAANRLIVVEKSAELATHLSKRFPDVRVMHADAADVASILSHVSFVKTVVSCLPLRSLPVDQVRKISHAWAQSLDENGDVIQFTYAPFTANAWMCAGLRRRSRSIEWGNLPPAAVEVFSKR